MQPPYIPPDLSQMVHPSQLHPGDHIAVADPGHGSLEAVVVEVYQSPLTPSDVYWEAADHHCAGCLHCSRNDLVNRLTENRVTL
jgi:hypothetical protein